MSHITRRSLLLRSTAAPSTLNLLFAESPRLAVDETLRSGIATRKIPAVVAMAANSRKTLYSGAFGVRDSSGTAIQPDSIFQIASMTKAITTAAALQLVEQGKVSLDEPIVKRLPQFADIQVLRGFDSSGEAELRPAQTAPTLRHLLTHTSGLCYNIWNGDMFRYAAKHRSSETVPGPLMFEPGTNWSYGMGLDWAGRLVETLSGLTLEDYFQRNILQPLGMLDTSYILPAAKFDRLVGNHTRLADGSLRPDERKQPATPKTFNGGGGLFSTAPDYVRFMQAILNGGMGPNKRRILQEKTVASMGQNQIGDLSAGKMKSFLPNLSADVDMQPGATEKWGLGFLMNPTPYAEGRSAGSLAWAGFFNTYYWIDPKRKLCGVILMQFLPFADKEAIGLLSDFERAVYRARLS